MILLFIMPHGHSLIKLQRRWLYKVQCKQVNNIDDSRAGERIEVYYILCVDLMMNR